MEWSQPTIEQRKTICYDCKLFLGGACDGFDEDIKDCEKYTDCWKVTDGLRGSKMIAEKEWSIVTDSREKAESIINTILVMCDPGTVERRIVSKDSMTVLFSDGARIRWYKAFLNSLRGMKCSRLWCDRYVDMRLMDYIKACYFGEDKDIIWI